LRKKIPLAEKRIAYARDVLAHKKVDRGAARRRCDRVNKGGAKKGGHRGKGQEKKETHKNQKKPPPKLVWTEPQSRAKKGGKKGTEKEDTKKKENQETSLTVYCQ